jgi:hypothetical protein
LFASFTPFACKAGIMGVCPAAFGPLIVQRTPP